MTTSTIFFTTCILMISTTQASTSLKNLNTTTTNQLNSSSCIPIVLRMTICLDFLVTGSTVPTPSDQCCLRLGFTTELDFPCLWDLFKGGKGWGHHKLNRTRAGSLPLSCGIPFPFPPLKSGEVMATSKGVQQAALTPESSVADPPGQGKTDQVDDEHVEGPESSASRHKFPRFLLRRS